MHSMTLDGAFAHLATLTTDRLRIRQMQPSDAEAIFTFKSDPNVTKHYGQQPQQTIEETRAWVQRNLTDFERHGSIMWALTLKDEDRAIGECCLWNFDSGYHCAEIGYELHPAYWHKGIMTEALSAILTYGFEILELHRIEANPLAINEASQNLLQKLGFKHEGTLRQRYFYQDRFFDQLYFGLLGEEWMDRRVLR